MDLVDPLIDFLSLAAALGVLPAASIALQTLLRQSRLVLLQVQRTSSRSLSVSPDRRRRTP
jgi:hypothetical protein